LNNRSSLSSSILQAAPVSPARLGILYMLFASMMFAAMGACVYHTKNIDPDSSALTASFVRICVNLIFVLGLATYKSVSIKHLFGDYRLSLWFRGLFGTLSLMCFFVAILELGLGEASFIQSTNTFWIALAAPFFLKQSNSRYVWLAIAVGMSGLYFLYNPDFSEGHRIGSLCALGSSVFAACAYLMVSKAGKSNSSLSVVFYFALVAVIIHAVLFMFVSVRWPVYSFEWLLLIAGGLFASVAQIYMTKAYQTAPAAVVSATAYSVPIFSMLISVVLFSILPGVRTMIGAAIVVSSGIILSFSQQRAK
jgi:S-adenosylmethionine uptake transporter